MDQERGIKSELNYLDFRKIFEYEGWLFDLDSAHIYIGGEIDDYKSMLLQHFVHLLVDGVPTSRYEHGANAIQDSGAQTIYITINSNGGSLVSSLAIYDCLTSVPTTVIVKVNGMASSGATIIACAGDERIIHKNSTIMIHDAAISFPETKVGDLDTYHILLNGLRQRMINIYHTTTGKPIDKIIKDIEKGDCYLTAEEACKYGKKGFFTRLVGRKYDDDFPIR